MGQGRNPVSDLVARDTDVGRDPLERHLPSPSQEIQETSMDEGAEVAVGTGPGTGHHSKGGGGVRVENHPAGREGV